MKKKLNSFSSSLENRSVFFMPATKFAHLLLLLRVHVCVGRCVCVCVSFICVRNVYHRRTRTETQLCRVTQQRPPLFCVATNLCYLSGYICRNSVFAVAHIIRTSPLLLHSVYDANGVFFKQRRRRRLPRASDFDFRCGKTEKSSFRGVCFAITPLLIDDTLRCTQRVPVPGVV